MTIEQTTITPVGAVIAYHGTIAPTGYFACDGREFDAEVYPKLATMLGKNSVPDLRGYFIRGYDTSNEVDTNGAERALGSVQGDAIRNMTGRVGISNWRFPELSTDGVFGIRTKSEMKTFAASTDKTILANFDFDASRVVPVADENRPKNVNLLYCIKHDEPETLPVPEKASPAETIAGINDSKYTTPFGIKTAIDQALSLVKQCACVKASTAEAVAGTDDEKYVTPAGVAAAIAESACDCPSGGSGGGSFNLVTDGPEVAIPGEYWEGKQVYARKINFGALPNNSQKSKAHNIDHMDLFCVDESRSWVIDDAGNHRGLSRPTTSYYNYYVNNSVIYMSTAFNASSHYATVTVLYTKTTDEPIA